MPLLGLDPWPFRIGGKPVNRWTTLSLACIMYIENKLFLNERLILRSFGHQGALYYVFLASDPLKTSREYAVFTLRTRGPKVCTRETSRQTQRVNAFFVLIAPNDRITSYIAGHWRPGQNFMMFQRTKNETWFSKNGNIKNLVKVQKWGVVGLLCMHIFALLVLNLV